MRTGHYPDAGSRKSRSAVNVKNTQEVYYELEKNGCGDRDNFSSFNHYPFRPHGGEL